MLRMRWSKGWIAAAGVVSVVAAVGGTAFALAGSGTPASQTGVAGKEVCAGQPVGVVESGGPAGVLSDQFPVGTSLRITNLANGRAATVAVAEGSVRAVAGVPSGVAPRVSNSAAPRVSNGAAAGASAGCVVVNRAAFELLRSSDSGQGEKESVLRRVRVEIVGNAPAPVQSSTRSSAARVRASGVVGSVVCDGATVGLSTVGGAPGAFSSSLPVGTSIRVTNLDNGRQATVRIVGVGSGCVVLNSAAFELVGEAGKSSIKRAQIEKVT
ncbi:hypothetical protein C8D88_10210 [Lentzea atacamensis]|uniref:Secreted protein n=1 Tax=Lentzea atacamensis TaxID=531938 RepID=A0A316I5J0_9PSEU|nr:hypothetical protein C8D88_10210 [Lentzea atacamensis]RAS61251.1 hypothetical protein C8D87_110199 [Lentzea atacamensis]